MQTQQHKSHTVRNLFLLGVGASLCMCVGFIALANAASNDPAVQATGTARSVAQATAAVLAKTPRATSTPTAPKDTATAGPSPTPTESPLPSPTGTPNWAGASEWLEKDGRVVGVKEVWWGRSLALSEADTGKTFVSLYILAVNNTNVEWLFDDGDFKIIDGGGEIHNALIYPSKEPEFGSCKIQTGGTCEGWWTTQIWNRDEVKAALTLRWDPGLFDFEIETDVEPAP